MAPNQQGGRGGQTRRGVYLILAALTKHTFVWINERAGKIVLPRKCNCWQKEACGSQVGDGGSEISFMGDHTASGCVPTVTSL